MKRFNLFSNLKYNLTKNVTVKSLELAARVEYMFMSQNSKSELGLHRKASEHYIKALEYLEKRNLEQALSEAKKGLAGTQAIEIMDPGVVRLEAKICQLIQQIDAKSNQLTK